MGDKVWNPRNLFDVFGDSLSRRILLLANDSPVSATVLVDELDVTPPTVYRRLDELGEHDLVKERRRIDERGNHYRTFETSLHRVEFEIEDGRFTVDVDLRRDLTDRFEAFWSEFEGGRPDAGVDSPERGDRPSVRDDVSTT
ncbi:winged helix-turn-helix transcriptional regulator [Halorarum halophilum]|uniref:Winged helix-turn-helix transcriptional regulator n=1 Tax=Halorarum halophilum TaxID=2743090 RepID=A0A7D5L2P4_9EURY|nr:winged helix-turn-helix domain-containing protein [Halobaculum halophilum]QLG27203.1 winged helix-turn-helix transcriptional regulator [Halobaculum halophilum]